MSEVLNINMAIPAIMSEIKAIGKNQKNKQQNFNFRGIDDIYNHVQAVMAKHHVSTSMEVLEFEKSEFKSRNGANGVHYLVKFKITFYAGDGSERVNVLYGESMDYGDKGMNKAISIADKYALLTTFKIPTEELKDADAEAHQVESRFAGSAEKKAIKTAGQKNRWAAKQIAEIIKTLTGAKSSAEIPIESVPMIKDYLLNNQPEGNENNVSE